MEKAPGAFRTISEVAQELEVPQHVLRFWESRFREIRPMKRGGGRRYYRPDDLDLLTLTDQPSVAVEKVLEAYRLGGDRSPHTAAKADAE